MSDPISALDLSTISSITADSRTVIPGAIFVALSGSKANGAQFVDQAIRNGAAIIISNEPLCHEGVRCIRHENPRLALTLLAARFYPGQPGSIVAVTGTNGKTSIAHFCRMIWQLMGEESASIGTIGVIDRTDSFAASNNASLTTPDPVTLHRTLQELAGRGVTHLALEASSHGLDQYRLDGVRVQAAAFTNLSRDHLDYHHSFEAYLAAKMHLFDRVMAPHGVVVLNADCDYYAQTAAICHARQHRIISYGYAGKQLRLLSTQPTAAGQVIDAEIEGQRVQLHSKLVGEFQAGNLLAALGLVIGAGGARDKALAVLEQLPSVPGRMEHVSNATCPGQIFVDYSHTPDALEKALLSLRPHTERRLVVIMGCGGDRDKGKRPLMGEIAARYADHVIVTDDNPRSEDPAIIRAEVMQGCPNADNIGNRHEAITQAVAQLQAGDVLLIAGKGHEKTQIMDGKVIAFDDVAVAAAASGR
jgi:UDP-N-acetylmuramyl-tripeptide synthetase